MACGTEQEQGCLVLQQPSDSQVKSPTIDVAAGLLLKLPITCCIISRSSRPHAGGSRAAEPRGGGAASPPAGNGHVPPTAAFSPMLLHARGRVC
jgi:hypothetical protein